MNEEDVKLPTESTVEPTEEVVPEAEPVEEEKTLPGDKTPANLLLESLQEERKKRRELEEKLAQVESPVAEAFSDEGRMLQEQIKALKDDIALRDVAEKYPQLKSKKQEFEEYRSQYPNIEMESIAKLFLAENDLLVSPQKRKGLEQASGGPRVPTSSGPTPEELETMRNTNFRKYSQLIKEGKIKV